MSTRVMAAVVRVAGPPDVIVLERAETSAAGNDRSAVTGGATKEYLVDNGFRSDKPFLIRFFRELR